MNYALACCDDEKSRISPFMSGPLHLEEQLTGYRKAIECGAPRQSFYETLSNTASVFERQMVMVIISDAEGLAQMDEKLVKRLIYHNDVYIFRIEDALLTSENAYDLDDDRFADPFLSIFGDLHREEQKIREDLEKAADHLLTRNRIFFKNISKEEEIVDTLIYLFGRRKGIT